MATKADVVANQTSWLNALMKRNTSYENSNGRAANTTTSMYDIRKDGSAAWIRDVVTRSGSGEMSASCTRKEITQRLCARMLEAK